MLYGNVQMLGDIIATCVSRITDESTAYGDCTADLVQSLTAPFMGTPCAAADMQALVAAVAQCAQASYEPLVVAACNTLVAWHTASAAERMTVVQSGLAHAPVAKLLAAALPHGGRDANSRLIWVL